MRIAIAVEGTRGDVYPMLALGASLKAAGHDVVLCAPPDFRDCTEARGLAFQPVGQDVRLFLERQARALHGGGWQTLREGQRFFIENVHAQFSQLSAAATGAELVIAAGTQLAASSVAEQLGARYRYVAYCPQIFPSAEHPPFVVPRERLAPWANRLLWWGTRLLMNTALRGRINGERSGLGLTPVRDLFPLLLGQEPALAVDEDLAGPPEDTGLSVQQIGCLHPFREDALPEKLEAFLAAGDPPVYVGFGSMTDPAPEATTRLVLEAVARSGVRVVLSEGWAGLGSGPLPPDVTVVGPVCHASLFQRVAAVVHHGGAGTTTTAARAGAPQILVPHVLDQFYWSGCVARLGLGPPALRRSRLRADALAETLRAVRDNDLLSERAQALGQRLRDAIAARPDPASAIL